MVTGEGVLWLTSIRDAFANRIVGWATDPRATTTLVLTALNHALRSRRVRSGELIHHSDKGSCYTALRFTQRLADAGLSPSTGTTGDSYDTQSTIVGEGVISELARHTSGPEVRYPGGMMVLDAVSGSDPSYDRPLGADALICRLRGGVPRRDRGYARVTR